MRCDSGTHLLISTQRDHPPSYRKRNYGVKSGPLQYTPSRFAGEAHPTTVAEVLDLGRCMTHLDITYTSSLSSNTTKNLPVFAQKNFLICARGLLEKIVFVYDICVENNRKPDGDGAPTGLAQVESCFG